MAKKRTTWREKLEKEQEPKIVFASPDSKMAKRFGSGKMLIPKPLDVDALIRRVEKGKLVTNAQLRERLARDFKVDFTCPITTGIFVRISAEAAEENRRAGKKEVTPYWRVIKPDGGLNQKFPGGVEAQAARLREEGHSIHPAQGKKPPRVIDFQKSLQQL